MTTETSKRNRPSETPLSPHCPQTASEAAPNRRPEPGPRVPLPGPEHPVFGLAYRLSGRKDNLRLFREAGDPGTLRGSSLSRGILARSFAGAELDPASFRTAVRCAQSDLARVLAAAYDAGYVAGRNAGLRSVATERYLGEEVRP